jgi:hypothetical protein
MQKGMKWFLGIVIGVVIVAALAGAGYLVFSRWHGSGWMMGNRDFRFADNGRMQSWRDVPGQKMPWNTKPQYERPANPLWGTPANRFGGFRPLQMLFGCMIAIGLLVLLVLGVIYLVRILTRHPQPAVTPTLAAAPVPATAQSTAHVCPHCARPVQDDWSHCPYCGGPLADKTEGPVPLA